MHTPDSPLVVVLEVVAVARARVREASGAAVLVADGILVDRGIGLGCAVVRRGDAVTGFTAIVAVPVIYSTVLVFICTEGQGKRKIKLAFLLVVFIEHSNMMEKGKSSRVLKNKSKRERKEHHESDYPNLRLVKWQRDKSP